MSYDGPRPFYEKTLRQLVERGTITIRDTVLVICGGSLDAEMLKELASHP